MMDSELQLRFFALLFCCIISAGGFIYHSALSFNPSGDDPVILITHRTQRHSGSQSVSVPQFTDLVTNSVIRGFVRYIDKNNPQVQKDVSGLYVCAESSEHNSQFCSNTLSEKSRDGMYGFEIYVNPGNYYVYAATPGISYKAYFDNYVSCGLQSSCKAQPVKLVTVAANQSSDTVLPLDWFQP